MVSKQVVPEPTGTEPAVPDPAAPDPAVSAPTAPAPSAAASRLRLRLGHRPTRLGLVTYAVTQAILLGWWFALYPGLMSYDTVMYIWQATTSHWSTSHSVVYNALLWLSLQATGGLGLLTFVQTTVMATALAYVVTGLRQLHVRGKWLAVAAIAAVCLPAVGTFTVYVSKDVAFVLCEVWLLGTIARLLVRPRRGLWWGLFAELALIGVFRPNGFLVIALAVLGIALALRSRALAWRVTLCGVSAIAVAALATNAVFPAIGVQRAGSELVLGPAFADLAVALHDRPSVFRPNDLALLSTVAPLSYWRDTANCYNADSTVAFGRPRFSIDAARAHAQELFALWVRVLEYAPDVIIQARICRGSIAWNPLPGPAPQATTVKIPISGAPNAFNFPKDQIAQSPFAGAIKLDPISTTARHVALFARRVTDPSSFEWIAWRGATWAYVAYIAVGLFAWRRRSWAPVALIAIVAATQITVTVNNPGQLVRYMEGPLVLGILLLPLAFAKPRAPAPVERN